MLKDHAGWIAIAALTTIVLALLTWLVAATSGDKVALAAAGVRRFGRRRPHREHFRPEGSTKSAEAPKRIVAIIVNPTKFHDLAAVRAQVTKGCLAAGWDQPLWLETTAHDPGTGQTRQAVVDGAMLVCPLGGDGTVRAVAEALIGTETPMGLLPGGTANLLARNLNLPVDSLDAALKVALTGQNKRIDVGRLTVDPSGEHESPEEHVFLIMAGVGFDAAIMADAPERLKKTVGPMAYTISGAKNLRGPQFKVRMKLDGEPEFTRRARTVVIGNCGKITGGLVLMPEAQVDDGWLDAVILSPAGVVGWVAVAGRVLSKRRKGHQRVDHHRLKSVTIRTDRPERVQIDGDIIGQARALSATIDPLALIVRVG
ncbi:MAG: diacylglycerol kinase family protein [Actinomycetota bacterium]